MAEIKYPMAAFSIILLIFTVVSLAPKTVEDISQGTINTSQLQDSTNVSAPSTDANATDSSGAVDQATKLAAVLSNPESGNRILSGLFQVLIVGLAAWIAVVIWVG